jgi:outer membrane protein TolC
LAKGSAGTKASLAWQHKHDELQKSYDAAKRSVELSLYQYQEGIVGYQQVLVSQRC